MKILRITAEGLPLFKEKLDLCFYATKRVSEEDQESLYNMADHYYLHSACTFIGLNASGKTSVLKVIDLALNIVNHEPINHVKSKNILAGVKKATICIYFYDHRHYICCLETIISANKTKYGQYHYVILSERMCEKPLSGVKSKKYLTDFTGVAPVRVRHNDEPYLLDDMSMIISYHKKMNESLEVLNFTSFSKSVLQPIDEISCEAASFLDPSIEKLDVEESQGNTFIHLKYKDEEEIVLRNMRSLEQYLSTGTMKGLMIFSLVKKVFQSGGYLLIDDMESHLNKEVVRTIIRFFMDHNLNKNGGTLIFTTHDEELLDEYERNDGIYITKNCNGITAQNLSQILKRNDIKKSEVYRSSYLQGTAPSYDDYMHLKKSLND